MVHQVHRDTSTPEGGAEMEKAYKKLVAWQKANELAHKVYEVSKSFPKDEMYGMTSQMRPQISSKGWVGKDKKNSRDLLT